MSDEGASDNAGDLDPDAIEAEAERVLSEIGDRDLDREPGKRGLGRNRDEGSGTGSTARKRFVGFIGLILGALGILIALVSAVLVLRLLFVATSTVERLFEPLDAAIDRVESGVDLADDVADRDGVAPEAIGELEARADGLVDATVAANDIFDSIQNHPLYGLLPADLASLDAMLGKFETSAAAIDDSVASRTSVDAGLGPVNGAVVSDGIDDLQARVAEVRELRDDGARSLRRWLRVGALVGFLLTLWGLWAQICLARRGMRGVRGLPL